MKAKTLYRIAAMLFVLFTAGHTFGFLSFKASSAAGAAVRAEMDRVPVEGAATGAGSLWDSAWISALIWLSPRFSRGGWVACPPARPMASA